MLHHNNYSGRLFLAKGNEQIFVDVSQLLQHQIEGIRFLYGQFKKKNTGVILNDPTGSGKTHQVVLFLMSIKKLLRKPILIVCGAHEKNHWLTHFHSLTDFGSGILVDMPPKETLEDSVNIKRMSVCIGTKSILKSLVSHDWSIVVIDDDSAINEVLKRTFKTEYKIWVTSVDMKTNLEAFSSIFGWLCPKEKDVQNIKFRNKDMQCNISGIILLDAIMEHVVLRRMNDFPPFKKQKIVEELEVSSKCKKNKDVTGTKIKRSKVWSTTTKNDNLTEIISNKQSREEPMLTDENNFMENTEPMNTHVPKQDILESLSMTSYLKQNIREIKNNVSQDIKLKYEETCEIEIEPNILITDDTKTIDKRNVSHHCEQGDDKNKLLNIVPCLQPSTDINIENNINTSHLNIDEVMTETGHEDVGNIITESNNPFSGNTKVVDINTLKQSEEINDVKNILQASDSSEQQPLRKENLKSKHKSETSNKSIEETMKEMEQRALQKFKGSLLDSIF